MKPWMWWKAKDFGVADSALAEITRVKDCTHDKCTKEKFAECVVCKDYVDIHAHVVCAWIDRRALNLPPDFRVTSFTDDGIPIVTWTTMADGRRTQEADVETKRTFTACMACFYDLFLSPRVARCANRVHVRPVWSHRREDVRVL